MYYSILLGGIIPFAILFLNWHEFLSSVNKGEYLLSIDYTMAVSILFLIATSEITIVLIFLQLCAEVHKKEKCDHVNSSHLTLFFFSFRIIIGGGNPL